MYTVHFLMKMKIKSLRIDGYSTTFRLSHLCELQKTPIGAWAMNKEVRVKLMLGDKEVEHMAREAISKKFDMKTAEFAKY